MREGGKKRKTPDYVQRDQRPGIVSSREKRESLPRRERTAVDKRMTATRPLHSVGKEKKKAKDTIPHSVTKNPPSWKLEAHKEKFNPMLVPNAALAVKTLSERAGERKKPVDRALSRARRGFNPSEHLTPPWGG